MNQTPRPVTLDELEVVLNPPSRGLPALDSDIDIDELLEIAAEHDERGPLATIHGMLEALRMRHSGDDTTLAALAAIEHYHLPMLIDNAKG